MSKPRKRRGVGRVRHDGLIQRIVDGNRTPAELAEELGLSLADLATWASNARNLSCLEHLARLADIRAQMVVSNYRATAAAQLIRIAASSTESDLARKACVDLLAADLSAFHRESQPQDNHPNDAPRDYAPEDALATLESIGRQALDQLRGGTNHTAEPATPPLPSPSPQ